VEAIAMNRPSTLILWRRGLTAVLCMIVLIGRPASFQRVVGETPGDLIPTGIPITQNIQPSGRQADTQESQTWVIQGQTGDPGGELEIRSEARDPGLGGLSEEPLRFTFPAAADPPISAWRPALYPAPWALTPFDHFYFIRPIQADEPNWPNADYRYGGVFFEDVVHTGVDIPTPIGTPVSAAAAGKVTWAGYGLYSGSYDPLDPYGLAIMIRHDFGFQGARLYTVYAHMSQADVVKGQRVETGSVLGLSGRTGKATGPHLHFEVRQEVEEFFSTYNPELWLVPPQGWGVLAGRVMNSGGLKLKSHLVQVRASADGRLWKANTYGGGNTHEDPFYRENVVISDLPAGRYEIEIIYLGKEYSLDVDIQPGLVTYFTFRGRSGYTSEPLNIPGSDFDPLSTVKKSN
jgi:hypothetical protein